MIAQVIPIKPQSPAVSEACRWHEAIESITASNLRFMCEWQRMLWRVMWGI